MAFVKNPLLALTLLISLAACTTPFTAAAGRGDLPAVVQMLDQGVDINEKDPNSMTALGMAAHGGHIEIVQVLLEGGADIDIKDVNGWTALDYAKMHANSTGDWRVAKILSEARDARIRREPLASFGQAPSAPPSPALPRSDVDRLPPLSSIAKKHAYAIVIGIEQYREKLPKADFADRDAKLIGEYLTKVMGYPEENVIVRTNDKASLTDLIKYFENWLPNNVEKDGSVFVYYSGHGAPNPKTGDAYMVPYDGDPTFVDATGYPMKRLYAALDKLPVKDVTVVLDSCFSGAGGRSVLAKGAKPMGLSVEHSLGATGRTIVLAASAGDQISSAYEEKGHGLLTYFFLKGLQGEADANKDGSIDMAELYDYVKPSVSRIARKQYNNEQTPQLLGSPDSLKRGGRLIERTSP